MKIIYFLSFVFFFFSQSCTIQKRVYQSGYHIEWNRKNISDHENELNSSSNGNEDQLTSDVPQLKNKIVSSDFIIDEVLEYESTKKPLIVESNDEIKSSNAPVSRFKNGEIPTIEAIDGLKRSVKKQNEVPKAQNGGKLQIVALILCVLLGLIGVHRFYLGYSGLGILYLLTLGLFGIGWIIDLILLIIPNGLTPKGKSNYKE